MPQMIRGPGWGCSCPAPKAYPPERTLAVLTRAAYVDVELVKTHKNGVVEFLAWTQKDSQYVVTFSPTSATENLCKHIVACAAHLVGDWLMNVCVQAGREDELAKEQGKRIRKLERRLKRKEKE